MQERRFGQTTQYQESPLYTGNFLGAYVSKSELKRSGEATISQYIAWHSVEDYANPLADWSEDGDWS